MYRAMQKRADGKHIELKDKDNRQIHFETPEQGYRWLWSNVREYMYDHDKYFIKEVTK